MKLLPYLPDDFGFSSLECVVRTASLKTPSLSDIPFSHWDCLTRSLIDPSLELDKYLPTPSPSNASYDFASGDIAPSEPGQFILSSNDYPPVGEWLDSCIPPYTPAEFQQPFIDPIPSGALSSPFLFESPIPPCRRVSSSPSDWNASESPCCNPSTLSSPSPILDSGTRVLTQHTPSPGFSCRRSERTKRPRYSPMPLGDGYGGAGRVRERDTAPGCCGNGVDDDNSSDDEAADYSPSKRRWSRCTSKPVSPHSGKSTSRKKDYSYESITDARRRLQSKALQGVPYRDVGTENVKKANRQKASAPPRFFCSLCRQNGKAKGEGFTHIFRCWSHIFSHFDIRPYECSCSWLGCTIDAVGRHVKQEEKKATGESSCAILGLREPIEAWLALAQEFGGYVVPAASSSPRRGRKRDQL
ncbi:hypothetical protein BKA70DRAFT_1290119 [Coprinopsis sp. MPI-PUGE-AT-0042]|nr:hypothetical protein BKA70DRAFT_1290119 [Coprinopsis sp. MPI-PUGE-AT-0042]